MSVNHLTEELKKLHLKIRKEIIRINSSGNIWVNNIEALIYQSNHLVIHNLNVFLYFTPYDLCQKVNCFNLTNKFTQSISEQPSFNSFIGKKTLNSELTSLNIIRRVKNNKNVYIHAISQKDKKLYQNLKNIQEIELFDSEISKSEAFQRGKRSSKYRGVSRNGNQWQVLIMVNKKKKYVGSYFNEEEAARAYDIIALQNHGCKAKTNFFYTDEEIDQIVGCEKN